jgi:cytochrome P450 family 89 subfamily A
VLDVLLACVRAYGKEGTSRDVVMEPFQYAMFCLLVYMCFGDRIGGKTARAIEATLQGLLDSFLNFQVFSPPPPQAFAKLVFHRRWEKLVSLRRQ